MPAYAFGEWRPTLPEDCWIAPGARVMGRVSLAEGCGVWFGAVIRGDVDTIRIGEETNIQDNAVLHVDAGFPLRIGARVTVGHGAVLHGCSIEDEVLIGMGAVILNGARVGRGSLVAAGALLREGSEFPPYSLIVGLPAQAKRSLPAEETLAAHRASALHYRDQMQKYRQDLREVGHD